MSFHPQSLLVGDIHTPAMAASLGTQPKEFMGTKYATEIKKRVVTMNTCRCVHYVTDSLVSAEVGTGSGTEWGADSHSTCLKVLHQSLCPVASVLMHSLADCRYGSDARGLPHTYVLSEQGVALYTR